MKIGRLIPIVATAPLVLVDLVRLGLRFLPQWPKLIFAVACFVLRSGFDFVKYTSAHTESSFWLSSARERGTNFMEHKGVEYSVVQLTDDAGWRWEIRFDDGKTKSGVSRVSREVALKIARYEIDLALKDKR